MQGAPAKGANSFTQEQALSDYSTDATVRGDYHRSGGWAGYDGSGKDM